MVEHQPDEYTAFLARERDDAHLQAREAIAGRERERAERLAEGRKLSDAHTESRRRLKAEVGALEKRVQALEGMLKQRSDEFRAAEAQLAQERETTRKLRQSAKRVERLLAEVVRGDGDQIDVEQALREIEGVER